MIFRILLYLSAALSSLLLFATEVPNPRSEGGWVSDQAGYLSQSGAIHEINRVLSRLEAETGIEIAVVILPSIGNKSPREFATSLFETWKIGKKDTDNGILLLHVIDQRRLEIEMGYGLEGILTDNKNKRILDEVVIPQFRSENFSMGIYLGVLALERGVRNPKISVADLLAPFEFDYQYVDGLDSTIESQENSNQNPNFLMQFIKSPIQSILKYSISFSFILLYFFGILFGEFLNIFSYGSKITYNLCLYIGVIPSYFGITAGTGVLVYSEINETETLFSILPVLPLLIGLIFWNVSILHRLRVKPRKCSKCGSTKYRLSESDDDKHLTSGQRVEERIKSRDYDVWLCNKCNDIHVEEYSGEKTVDKCPKCHYRTHLRTDIQVLRVADYNRGGEELHTYLCAHCSHTQVKRITTPKLEKNTSSSSGSGGSSFGGGSFGGGRSGGGGAGSSY
ncbi:MAG: TPM domain-containing protein [Leptospira sp.]|nr:TPM domain-containing protein [Leptospira sp.]